MQHNATQIWELEVCASEMTAQGNTLQHTATHCNTLQHTVTHCNILQHTATHCYTLQHTATRIRELEVSASEMTAQTAKCKDEFERNGQENAQDNRLLKKKIAIADREMMLLENEMKEVGGCVCMCVCVCANVCVCVFVCVCVCVHIHIIT